MIEALFPPCGTGYIVALRAYLDASVREDRNIICVAGAAYGYKGAKKASKKWKDLFGEVDFHMTDFHTKKNAFSGISDEEQKRLLVEAISIVKKYSSYKVAASFDYEELQGHLPSGATRKHAKEVQRGFENPYALACHSAMYALSSRSNSEIYYVFETGDKGQGAAKRYIDYISQETDSPLFAAYQISGLIHAKKDSSHVLLQSADLLAWEWTKHIVNRSKKIPTRRSLNELIGFSPIIQLPQGGYLSMSDDVEICHFSGQNFTNILDDMGQLLSLSTADEVNSFRASRQRPLFK